MAGGGQGDDADALGLSGDPGSHLMGSDLNQQVSASLHSSHGHTVHNTLPRPCSCIQALGGPDWISDVPAAGPKINKGSPINAGCRWAQLKRAALIAGLWLVSLWRIANAGGTGAPERSYKQQARWHLSPSRNESPALDICMCVHMRYSSNRLKI